MLEGVFLGNRNLLVNEFRRFQPCQLTTQLRLRHVVHGSKDRHVDVLPDNGRGLKQLSIFWRQSVESGHEHILNGLGDRNVGPQFWMVDNGSGKFLQEKWHTFSARDD